jgi:hypothetical protein
MPVCTLIKPMRLHCPGGLQLQYGVGQYWFNGMDAYNPYVLLHTANGRPELDSVKITDPGPPVIDVSSHPWMPT